MKQVIQDLASGKPELMQAPCPALRPGHLLIRTRVSLISPGTERMLVEFGRAGLVSMARRQPERVRQVLEKVRTDGLIPTIEAVRAKLDQPLPLGYSNVGVVLEVGDGVHGFSPGDRVVSNGYHAEIVCVPKNLCARIPDAVSDDAAAFTVLGAVALQAVRLAQPTIGERFAVSGLGLVGLLAVQILRANGCSVLGLDFDPHRLGLAAGFGAATADISRDHATRAADQFSAGEGIDGVIIAASTPSSAPVRDAARMCRKRGRVVLVGVTGLELSRADFYQKEITFQVSCSYGPGRYDPAYEIEGHDYPAGFVRWTEQRNFEAVLRMLAEKRVATEPLVSHRFPLEQAGQAYDLLAGGDPSLGVLLEYPSDPPVAKQVAARTVASAPARVIALPRAAGEPTIAFVGPGSFASRVLIPILKTRKVRLKYSVSASALSCAVAARKFGFEYATTDLERVLADREVNAVMIATRHDTHAAMVCRALAAHKHVFVEKPLAITGQQLSEIEDAWSLAPCGTVLAVGFNRRFAPHVRRIKSLLEGIAAPKTFVAVINAGPVPAGHWTRDPVQGGGRLLGETCHFIDLIRFLAGHPAREVKVSRIAGSPFDAAAESATVTISFRDGSSGTIHYLCNGHRGYPKERIQVFAGGCTLELDNFRKLRGWGFADFRRMNLWRQDKGHGAEIDAFLDAVRGIKPAPIPVDELFEVSRLTLAAAAAS